MVKFPAINNKKNPFFWQLTEYYCPSRIPPAGFNTPLRAVDRQITDIRSYKFGRAHQSDIGPTPLHSNFLNLLSRFFLLDLLLIALFFILFCTLIFFAIHSRAEPGNSGEPNLFDNTF